MANASNEPSLKDLPDSELLRRFTANRDDAAFAEIVLRHCQLVLGVCRRVLGNRHDEEDAFQATFLVLAKNAAKIRRRSSLSSWLYGVAFRVALKARKRNHQVREDTLNESNSNGAVSKGASALEQLSKRGDEQAVDEELHALPEKYRAPLVLHYLENQTNKEIASALRLSVAAVEGRLKRGRAELRRRLIKRGVTLACFGLIVSATRQALSAPLIQATVEASVSFARGTTTAASAVHHNTVQQLARSEMIEMTLMTKKLVGMTAVSALAATFGIYGFGAAFAEGPAQPAEDGKRITLTAEEDADQTPTIVKQNADYVDDPFGIPRPADAGPSRRRIVSRLTKPIEFTFMETPLVQVAEHLSKLLDFPVAVDWKALETLGLEKDEPITRAVLGISARAALRSILHPLKLDYTIRGDSLVITSAAALDAFGADLPPGRAAANAGLSRSRIAMDKINSRLEEPLSVEFLETPLSEVAAYLSELLKLPVMIDVKALEDIGVATDEPITSELPGLSARSALHLILDPLGLDYTIRDEVLMITSVEVADATLDTRIYLVEDDALPPGEDVAKLITKVVAPESWDEVGGMGVITNQTGARQMLIVSQSQRVHELIVDFLGQLRLATKAD